MDFHNTNLTLSKPVTAGYGFDVLCQNMNANSWRAASSPRFTSIVHQLCKNELYQWVIKISVSVIETCFFISILLRVHKIRIVLVYKSLAGRLWNEDGKIMNIFIGINNRLPFNHYRF